MKVPAAEESSAWFIRRRRRRWISAGEEGEPQTSWSLQVNSAEFQTKSRGWFFQVLASTACPAPATTRGTARTATDSDLSPSGREESSTWETQWRAGAPGPAPTTPAVTTAAVPPPGLTGFCPPSSPSLDFTLQVSSLLV